MTTNNINDTDSKIIREKALVAEREAEDAAVEAEDFYPPPLSQPRRAAMRGTEDTKAFRNEAQEESENPARTDSEHETAQYVKDALFDENDAFAFSTSLPAPDSPKPLRNSKPDIDQLSDSQPHRTDLGNAERMCRRYGSRLHYDEGGYGWLVWDGRKWNAEVASVHLNKYAKRVIRRIYLEAADEQNDTEKDKLIAHALRSEADNRIAAMLSRLRYEDDGQRGIDIPIEHTRLDAAPELFNVLNGTLNLKTGKLQEHRKEDLITKLANVEYDPEAKSDLWEDFLTHVTGGDQDLRTYLQRAAGYSLLGDNEDQRFFYLLGGTGGGKSTFCSAVLSVLGEYGTTADVNTILQFKNQSLSPRDDLARLSGARLICIAEIPEGSKLQVAQLKTMTGRDGIVARHLYSKNHLTFQPGIIWLHANHRARVPADEDALFSRLSVVPFNHCLPKTEQDKTIKTKLCKVKLSGKAIFAWLVDGCLAYQKDGLRDPKAVQIANAQYREEMNPVREWVRERCELMPGSQMHWEPSNVLYADYKVYCEENGIRFPLTNTNFGKGLASLGLEPKRRTSLGRSNTRGWMGIRLIGSNDDYSPETFEGNSLILGNDNNAPCQNSGKEPEGAEDAEIAESHDNETDSPF